MSEYTPTTDEIRDYVEAGGDPKPWLPPTPELDAKRAAAFDRWLSAREAEILLAAPVIEEQIIAWFGSHNSGAVRRVINAGEQIITGRVEDGVFE